MDDLASLAHTHWEFAHWQRVRHRAKTFALISFPDSHPLRKAVEDICVDLDPVQYQANRCLHEVVKKRGPFHAAVNGWWFDDLEEQLFKSNPQWYHDCPEISMGRNIRRDHELPLFRLASLHCVETRGRAFLEAAGKLVEATIPEAKKRLHSVSKVFEKDCRRVKRQLKRVRVCSKLKLEVLLCLHRWGIPGGNAWFVLEYLV